MGSDWLLVSIFQLLVVIGIFAVLVYLGNYMVYKSSLIARFKKSRFSNLLEYFPSEEILSLKQVSYLIMIMVFIVIILYLLFEWSEGALVIFVLDIIVSVYLAIKVGKDSLKERILLFMLIPFASLSGLMFGNTIIVLLDLFHIIGYLYFVKVYYRKFVEYTENNGLGITILLLFAIILVSFLFTIIVEDVSPMDSITMVTNAFTSNSFEASGKIMVGKLNSLVIAWSGFILSGVGTATLAASIVTKDVNRQFDEMKESIKNKREKD